MRLAVLVQFVSLIAGCQLAGLSREEPSPIGPSVPSPTSAEADQLAGTTVLYEGEIPRGDLSSDELQKMEDLKIDYLSAAQDLGLSMGNITLLQTRGSRDGDIGSYLRYLEDGTETYWEIHQTISVEGDVVELLPILRLVPQEAARDPHWDPDYARFVYVDEDGQAEATCVASEDQIVPVIENIAWRGFSVSERTYVREALAWFQEVAPERFDFLQAQRIELVDSSQSDIGGRRVAKAEADRITFYRLQLFFPTYPRRVQQARFLSILYHEAVHVRQFRDRQFCNREPDAYAAQAAVLQELRQTLSGQLGESLKRYIDSREGFSYPHDDWC